MSVDITIKNKQLFKKPLSIKDVSMGKYAYAKVDEHGRNTGRHEPGDIVVYNPKKIGRGITLSWDRIYKDEISLRVNHLSTKYDMEMFYDIVRNIMHVWKAKKFEQDGVIFNEADIEKCCQDQIQSSYGIMADVKRITGEKSDVVTIFGAMYPLDLDIDVMQKFGEEKDGEGYAEYLHNIQNRDIFYAVPLIYKSKKKANTYFASYALTSGVETALPLVPKLSFGAKDPETGGKLNCDTFVVALFSYEKRKVVGYMKYQDFAEKMNLQDLPALDKTHVILPGVSEEKMAELAKLANENPMEE